ncbi:MAG: hypothetical protein ACYCSA_00150 [Thermoplasmataceae archaeon]|jgi:hypothetical protein|nr:hypothetical protein [Candidatus Thermoplasmatota archaeon]
MILNDLIEKKVDVMLLNQAQENLSPKLRFEGVLKGIDQGTYIISSTINDRNEIIVLPIAMCRLNTKD